VRMRLLASWHRWPKKAVVLEANPSKSESRLRGEGTEDAGLRVNILGHFVKPDASAVRSDFISQSVISAFIGGL